MSDERQTGDWIETFCETMDHLQSPSLFKKWAAIAAVAGALERKVWIRSMGSELFPNLYTIIIAPPGIGKTMITKEVYGLWDGLPKHHLAPSNVTKASLIDELNDASRTVVRTNGISKDMKFNSLLISSNELGSLLPAYESEFMNVLTDIYDGNPYAERRRTKDLNIKLKHPQINLLAATTPSYLNGIMPEGAWDQGFISRVLMIFSAEPQKRAIFAETQVNNDERKVLQADLRLISRLYGQFKLDLDAVELLEHWHAAGGPPQPEHPNLIHYCTRRTSHLLKLCMVASVSRTNDLIITKADYQVALDWLLEAEAAMPDIFKSMSSGGTSRVIGEVYHYAYERHMRNGKKPVTEHEILNFLLQKLPAHQAKQTLDAMTQANIFKKQGGGYVPTRKH